MIIVWIILSFFFFVLNFNIYNSVSAFVSNDESEHNYQT